MATLSANQKILTKMVYGDAEGRKIDYQVAASTTIYKGGFVGLNATGYLKMYVASSSAAALTGDRFIGVAMDYVDNSSGSDGDKRCETLVSGSFEYVLTGAVIGDVGAPVFASDEKTLNKDATLGDFVGWIENFVSAGNVVVQLRSMEHSHPLIARISVGIDCTTADDLVNLIHPTENHNGLVILQAFAYVVTAAAGSSEDQPIITVQDTAGTTLGIVMTGTDTTPDAAGDVIAPAAGIVIGASTGAALIVVPADKGVQAKVTQAVVGTAAGLWRIGILAMPIA